MSSNGLDEYEKVKDKMRTGDLLLWKSNKWGWRFYRQFCNVEMDHSSMVIRLRKYEVDKENRFITESRLLGQHGTVLNRLSNRLRNFHGELYWYPLKDEWDSREEAIGIAMLDLIGIPYNFLDMLKMVFQHTFGGKRNKVFKRMRRSVGFMLVKSVFCSEYCYKVYSVAKVTDKFPQATQPSPEDLLDLNIFNEGKMIFKRK